MNMDVYYISDEMLGDGATEDDARRMVEILTERGYDVEPHVNRIRMRILRDRSEG
jgi:hypothetical protein